MSETAAVILHALELPEPASYDADPDRGRHAHGYLQPAVGPIGRVIAVISREPGDEQASPDDELPDGAARAEATAVLVRQSGIQLRWGEPIRARSDRAAELFCFQRGRSSVDIVRARPDLISELQVGAWFNAGWRGRAIRRVLVGRPQLATLARRLLPRAETRRLAADVGFWAGVRAEATQAEWQRLTKSSYVVFCYHQLSARPPEIDERWHIPLRQFQRQLRLLAGLRYTPLTLHEALAFHLDPTRRLGPRRFLISADDGYLDALEVLQTAATVKPVAFVVTRFASRELRPERAPAFADWERIREASRQGVQIGSHTRRHVALVECDSTCLDDELGGSRADLRGAGLNGEDVLAYPYGGHDRRVREATIAAGYALAYTTRPGRNAAGTDPWCLRRISIEPDDGPLVFLWKALTGEALPGFVQRRRRRPRRHAPSADSEPST